MPKSIALLRGINVGGHNKIAMSDLRNLLGELGFTGAKSLLQSGNLVFQTGRRTGSQLEGLLEKETAKRLGVSADYLVRSADEWHKIVVRNPFPREAKTDPGHLVVVCLKSAPPKSKVDTLRAAIKGPETINSDGKQLYIVYPDGIGRSKLTGPLIESKLAIRGTARNWNTVLKLAALCE
ncbi:MAG: DUF1697 domain-containing protein [Planctomycetia bacterium]|nr:DUF1697 domain-containing protein [Planctomycetia bacterium]